jgi:predicted RNase H-like nuclease (RuvC/YqgF family)
LSQDTEEALSNSLDGSQQATEQTISDHEVIGFLDNKIRDLEKHVKEEQKLRDVLTAELESARKAGKSSWFQCYKFGLMDTLLLISGC